MKQHCNIQNIIVTLQYNMTRHNKTLKYHTITQDIVK